MVTSTSTLYDVMYAHRAEPTQTDLDSWVTITPLAAANTITTNVGLFGNDMTDFYSDCSVVATTECDANDYHNYTGWAIAV